MWNLSYTLKGRVRDFYSSLEKLRLQVGLAINEASAQAERERRESEWGIEDLDQEEEE
jgi:hypothetical protein